MIQEDAHVPSRVDAAVSELEELIRSRYPSAEFAVTEGDDPRGIYLLATVDIEDPDEVVDVFIGRLLQLQVDEALPVYVIPVRPTERIRATLLRQLQRPSPVDAMYPG
jgi:hypothetical protein